MKKPIKATRIFDKYFYCLWCGAKFLDAEKVLRDEHEEWCKELGFTFTPRSKTKKDKTQKEGEK